MTQSNDAIQEPRLDDVSADDQQDAAGDHQTQETAREPSERETRLAEIARQHAEMNGYGDEEEDTLKAGTEQDPAEQDAGGEQDPADDSADNDPLKALGYYRKDDGQLYTRMKINGTEREVPAAQITAYIQKDLAGDQKLQQAAERERRLQDIERQLKEREQQFQQSLSTQQPPTTLGAEESRQQAKQVLQKIWDGDDDAAAEALAAFIQQNNAGVDADQLLTQAEQRVMTAMERREAEKQQQVWQQSVEEGNRWLASQHPKIYKDERLFDLVNSETARLVESQKVGDPELANLTPKQIIERAARDVQAWMDGSEGNPEQTQDGRAERKANLKPMPRGMSKRPTPQAKQEVDMSPAAVVARMRQARGVN